MMRIRFYLLLLFIVASLVVVPAVKAHEAAPIGTWVVTGNMATARYGHTATLLNNGTVLVAGGQGNAGQMLATAEVYDPTTGTWTTTGSMATARIGHTATLLGNGKVLVAGGQDSSGHAISTAEIYDPTSGTWMATGSMIMTRVFHTATLLNDGTVLVTGGQDNNGNITSTTEIYNPTTGIWTATGNMIMTRVFHTATLLNDGTVLVIGGRDLNGSILTTAEVYNPTSGMWAAIKNMLVARSLHTATLLGNGKVLVVGGGAKLAELYDPVAGTWSPVGSMSVARISHTATLLSNGTILVTGGRDNNSQALMTTEIYNPTRIGWSPTGNMAVTRWDHTATLMGNGKVLVVGGKDNTGHALATAGLFAITDTTAPTLQLPGSITADATSTQGAMVTYSVTATDPTASADQVTTNCTPASGSVFPIGLTTVNCTAQDPAGNTSSGSFTVQVVVLDITPPTLQVPTTITADATSPQGATVTYTVTATDPNASAGQVMTSCTPASGSVFPIGPTTVNCTAQGPGGNTSGSFQVVVQDVTAPTLQVPATITMNATSPQGATVNYAVSATDPTKTADQIVITCTPVSGSVFSVGATTVDCSAQDPAGNTSTRSFLVIVQDVTAPTLQMPVMITAYATSSQGASVNYTVTATDPTNTPDQLKISCTPSSGSVFPMGTTAVICGAQDPAGNTTTGSFQVVVNPKTIIINIDAF